MKPWIFVHVADMQVGSPKSFRFEPAWNENWQTARNQILEINPDLLLVGGDLTRDGRLHRYELETIKEDLDSLPFPYYVIPGNMDTGNKQAEVNGPGEARDDVGWNLRSEDLEQWASIFGPTQWSFVHKGIRLSGFCDMLAGSGLAEETALWKWMDQLAKSPPAKHHVWIMHYALFIDDLHEPNWDARRPDQFLQWYFSIDEPYRTRIFETFKATGADLVITAHIHCRRSRLVEGIRFDYAPATCSAQFADYWPDGDPTLGFTKYDVTEHGIDSTFIPLKKVSTKQGYGPGGHPPPQVRDYSQAGEK